MAMEIRPLRREDYRKARRFAEVGMHFDWYSGSPFLRRLYSLYFWNWELSRATRAYGAYLDGAFAGALLAEVRGEPTPWRTLWRSALLRAFGALQALLAEEAWEAYDSANREMLEALRREGEPDGELLFLAADPALRGRGTGTALLEALAADIPGRTLYLYTDSACTYQFYDRRGFRRAGDREVFLPLKSGELTLRCLLYVKKFQTGKEESHGRTGEGETGTGGGALRQLPHPAPEVRGGGAPPR